MRPKVAVLVDGGFFLKRYNKLYPGAVGHNAEQIGNNIWKAAVKHVSPGFDLHRIYYYDCFPIGKSIHNPITNQFIDFAKTEIYKQRLALFEELKKKRKLALRLGHIKDSGNWQIFPAKIKSLLKGDITIRDLSGDDIYYEMRQKGIDFVLDPLWNPIDPNLFEHIDGLRSTSPKPIKLATRAVETSSKTP